MASRAGTRKHALSSAGGGPFAQYLSYLTSHAYGTGGILTSEVFSKAGDEGLPTISHRPVPTSAPGKTFTPAGVASTLTLKGVNIHSGKSLKEKIVPAALRGSRAGIATALTDYALELTDKDILQITEVAAEQWAALAETKLQGKALYEYLRAMRVQWKDNSLSLRLEGWEAASRELGWAPKPGGLDAGLGEYDGSLHSLKPLVLGGRSKRVIPMKLEGTASDFESKMREEVGGAAKIPEGRKRNEFNRIVSESVKSALATKPGEEVRLSSRAAKRSAPGEEYSYLVRTKRTGVEKRHRSRDLNADPRAPSFPVIDPKSAPASIPFPFIGSKHLHGEVLATPEDRENYRSGRKKGLKGTNFQYGSTKNFNGETRRVYYSRSTMQGAVRVKKKLKGLGELDSDGTFVVFRTMVSDDFAENSAPGKRTKKNGSKTIYRSRQRRMENDYYKWWTLGRAPYQLMEAVLSSMRSYISNVVMGKRAASIQKDLAKTAKDFFAQKYNSDIIDSEEIDKITSIISRVTDSAMEHLAANFAKPPKRRR